MATEDPVPQSSRGMDRRSVVKAAAWSVPAVAVAASVPAFAASTPDDPCVPTTFLDGLEPGTSPSSISFFPSTVMASLSYTSNGQGGDNTPGGTGQVLTASGAPTPWNFLEMEMVSQLDVGDWVELTITLSQPVVGLSFTLHDIDWVDGAWYDTVIVTPAGYTSTPGTNVQGAGTSGDPFRPISEGDNPISSGLGDVTVTYPLSGPISQVVIRYRAGITGNSGNQHIGLGDLSFENCPVTEENLSAQTLQGTALRSAPSSQPRPRHEASSGTPKFVPCDGTADS